MTLAVAATNRSIKPERPNRGTNMDLEALTDFVLVAAHGGIAQASRASGRPKASLSRKVMELEANLGVRLFERGSRSVRLTEEGELLYTRAAGPLGEIAEAVELLREGRAQPRGRLRLNVPTVFGQMLMGRLAAEFTRMYPDVKLDVTVEDRAVDPVAEGYDLVIRLNPKPEANLVGCCFARDRVLVVAAPSFAPPSSATIADEGNAVPVVVRSSMRKDAVWRVLESEIPSFPVRTVVELPTLPMVRDAALTGIGAARLPRILVAEDVAEGRLVSWGFAFVHASELWALYPSDRMPSSKVDAFSRFLENAFPQEWL